MTAATGKARPEDDPGELAVEYPCWRIWQSRPSGLWWATRRGNIQYHHQPRHPGWGITVGGVVTLAELAILLIAQREIDVISAPQG